MEVTDMVDTEVMEVMAMAVVMDTMERDLLMLKLMLSQDIMVMADMDTEDTEVMEDMDIEVTVARDLLMLSQDIVDTEVMEVMDMVADTTDKKLVHTIQFKAINHKFYFKTDSFSQLSKLLNKRIFFWV